MEYEIDTEHEALCTSDRAMQRRALPCVARWPITRIDFASEQFAELIPESEELAEAAWASGGEGGIRTHGER